MVASDVRCRNCGEPLEEGWTECPACEAPVASNRCPSCSKEVQPHWRKCPACKATLTPSASTPRGDTFTPAAADSSSPFLTVGPASGAPAPSRVGSAPGLPTPRPLAGPGAAPLLDPGELLLDQFEIRSVLGRGGYGTVYLAKDLQGEDVALKVVHSFGRGRELLAVLGREYQAQAKIEDMRHVVRVDRPLVCSHKGFDLVLLPMEPAAMSLRGWLQDRGEDEETTLEVGLDLLAQACRGVAAIHGAGLVHLDLKPENLLLFHDIEAERAAKKKRDASSKWLVKVADFGLARGFLQLGEVPPELRKDGIGTPAYMAPEQVLAAHWKDVTAAADIYALGMVLYELLDGDLPYSGSAQAVQEKKLNRDIDIRTPAGPGHLARVALQCLERDPQKRPGAASEVAALIREGPGKAAAFANAQESDREGGPPPANPLPFAIWRNPKDGLEYIFIPPGEFKMGASPDDQNASNDEKSRHDVCLTRGFWLCRTPVTVAGYRQFCEATGRAMPVAPGFNPNWQDDDVPIVKVEWEDAQAYCEWIGGRLPTEAEWEYAARAGTETRYWWGSEMDGACAWYVDNANKRTQPVGGKRANPWGLFDILGNVYEWCADWYRENYYKKAAVTDPKGPPSGEGRIQRGGSFYDYPYDLRVSHRAPNDPDSRMPFSGFRSLIELV